MATRNIATPERRRPEQRQHDHQPARSLTAPSDLLGIYIAEVVTFIGVSYGGAVVSAIPRPPGATPRLPGVGALAKADKADQAQQFAAALSAILELHRAEFPPAQHPMAPPLPPMDVQAVTAKHHRAALAGIGIFHRSARAAAKAAADQAARAEVDAIVAADQRMHCT